MKPIQALAALLCLFCGLFAMFQGLSHSGTLTGRFLAAGGLAAGIVWTIKLVRLIKS